MSEAAAGTTGPVVEGIFVPQGSDGRTHLLVSRCPHCGARAFPARERCAGCSADGLSIEEAATSGAIVSWTTQPGSTPPRVIAQVRLDDGLVVQGVVQAGLETVAIDMPVHTVTMPLDAENGVTYAFAPV